MSRHISNPPILRTSTSSQPSSLSLDMIIRALESFGPWGYRLKRSPRISDCTEQLKSWTEWDIRRDFASAIAGLCVLDDPTVKGVKTNVVASSLLPAGDTEPRTLLCAGNRQLTNNDNHHGTFFIELIQKLKAISQATYGLPSDSDLTLVDIRKRHTALADAENAFVTLVYQKHMPKLKARIKKRCPEFKTNLKELIEMASLQNEEIITSLLRHLDTMITLTTLNKKLTVEQVNELHRAGRWMSVNLSKHPNTFDKIKSLKIKGKTPKEFIPKIATTATMVNNLIMLASCTALREVLGHQLSNPTFIYSRRLPPNFSARTVNGNSLHSRFAAIFSNVESADKKLWLSQWTRIQPFEFNRTYVHCECIIALEILARKKGGKHYIGCPKLSCPPCYMFLEAVNEVGKEIDKEFEIVMDGCHGTWFLPWSIPLGTPSDVRDVFEKILLSSINNSLISDDDREKMHSNSEGAVDIAPYGEPNAG